MTLSNAQTWTSRLMELATYIRGLSVVRTSKKGKVKGRKKISSIAIRLS